MFLIKLFNILKGYVIITVTGLFTERFINLCTRRSISIWNTKKINKNQLSACVDVDDFKRLRPVAKKSYCKVHITRKAGLPFFLYRYKKRKVLLASAFISFVLLLVLTRFVWVINITGNEIISTDQMMEGLSKAGVKTGVFAKSIDKSYVRNILMTDIPELSWVGINVKGTTVEIDVKERTKLPPAFPKDSPCSIVAKNSGVIVRSDITEGDELIKPGDVVSKGQILVSGVLEGELSGIRYVHSDGVIIARTWHQKTVQLPMYKEIRTPTGREKSKNKLKIHNFDINFYIKDSISYENYDKITEEKKFSLGDNFVLPVSIQYNKYVEQTVTTVEMSKEEVLSKTIAQMDEELKGIEVVSKKHVFENGKLTVTYECLENIIEKVGF
ncbi:MAG: sporulation protein YqfD [Clostridia bacterium]|nr:sporulation protein YqfD [Clostridia bacterium]